MFSRGEHFPLPFHFSQGVAKSEHFRPLFLLLLLLLCLLGCLYLPMEQLPAMTCQSRSTVVMTATQKHLPWHCPHGLVLKHRVWRRAKFHSPRQTILEHSLHYAESLAPQRCPTCVGQGQKVAVRDANARWTDPHSGPTVSPLPR